MILDGTPLGTLNNLTNLSIPTFGASAVVTLNPSFTVGVGNHTLKVYTKNEK
jgi:hypothetical protein